MTIVSSVSSSSLDIFDVELKRVIIRMIVWAITMRERPAIIIQGSLDTGVFGGVSLAVPVGVGELITD